MHGRGVREREREGGVDFRVFRASAFHRHDFAFHCFITATHLYTDVTYRYAQNGMFTPSFTVADVRPFRSRDRSPEREAKRLLRIRRRFLAVYPRFRIGLIDEEYRGMLQSVIKRVLTWSLPFYHIIVDAICCEASHPFVNQSLSLSLSRKILGRRRIDQPRIDYNHGR